MLHTIIALGDIFYTPAENCAEFCPVPYGMATLSKTPDGRCIERVFSTDPGVYLNPSYQIGEKFRM